MKTRDANRNLLVEILVLWLYLGGLVFVVVGLLVTGHVLQLSYAENESIVAQHYGIAFFFLLASSLPVLIVTCVGICLKAIFVESESAWSER